MSAARCRPVPPNGSGLDPLYIKISDSGGLDLEAWCLDAWMLEGLEWIGGGDGGDGGIGMGGGDWKDVSHAQASGARRILVSRDAPAGPVSIGCRIGYELLCQLEAEHNSQTPLNRRHLLRSRDLNMLDPRHRAAPPSSGLPRHLNINQDTKLRKPRNDKKTPPSLWPSAWTCFGCVFYLCVYPSSTFNLLIF